MHGLFRAFPGWCLPIAVASLVFSGHHAVQAQPRSDLAGAWVLDRDLSQFPQELGFGAVGAGFSPGDDGSGAAARGRRGSRSGGLLQPALRPGGESYDEGRRRQLLSDEARTPPVRLTITETADAVTITDEKGRARTFRPGAGAESLPLENVSVLTVASREDGKLVVLYSVADQRQIRYTYSRALGGGPLVVDVQFLERGVGDSVRRVYKADSAGATATGNPAAPATASRSAAAPGSAGADRPAGVPAAGSGARAVLPRGGAEFKGLTRIGIVVEDPGPQAVSCGLTRDTLQSAVAGSFTGAGLRVTRDGDDDTYVYVRVISSMVGGTCVSRYDWTIYSMAEATLSHQGGPLLLQVELARRGGLVGSAPAAHAKDLLQQMNSGLAQVAATIRDANR